LTFSHLAYGLRVAANVPLPGLDIYEERGPADLHVSLKEAGEFTSRFSEPFESVCYVSPWTNENGTPVLRVGTFENNQYFGFLYGDGARFAIARKGNEIWGDWPENYNFEEACTYLVGPIIAFALRLRGVTCLHASSVAVGDVAIAFLGEAGAGKSTTAAAFAQLGFPVVSDDVVVLSDNHDRLLVQPAYPRVNLWPDSVCQLFGSESVLPLVAPTWGKRYLALNGNGYQFQSAPLPLGAVYVLGDRENDLTAPSVNELNASEAFVKLVANTYVNYLLDVEMRKREFQVLARIVAEVPVLCARSPNKPESVLDLCKTIAMDGRALLPRCRAPKSPAQAYLTIS